MNMITLNERDRHNIINNCMKRLLNENDEPFETEYDEDPFDEYSNDYPDDDNDIDNMSQEELSVWCSQNDFLYIYNPFGRWRISVANNDELQKDIASDVMNCAYIEKTHKMDYLLVNKFYRMFGRNIKVAVFELHDTKDGDYYVIYEE